MPANRRTYFQLVVTMFFWGGTWVAARYAVQEVHPLAVAAWRFGFAATSLLALVVMKHGCLPALSRRELGLVLALGATGIFCYNLFFLYGMRTISAGRGALVVAMSPVITLWAAAWLLREGMTRRKLAGSLLAFAGCLTVIGKGDPFSLLAGTVGAGETLILGCAVMWSAYTLIGRLGTRSLSALVMTTYASCAGFIMLLLVALVVAHDALAPVYSTGAWAAILFLGLLGTTLGFTWFSAAVQQIGAQRAAIFINLVPVAAVLQGALLLGERLDVSVLAGGVLVIAGVMLTQGPPATRLPA